jgi:hypothetical protein
MSGKIYGKVMDRGGLMGVIVNALVSLHSVPEEKVVRSAARNRSQETLISTTRTDERGSYEFCDVIPGEYVVSTTAFRSAWTLATAEHPIVQRTSSPIHVDDDTHSVSLHLSICLSIDFLSDSGTQQPGPTHAVAGRRLVVQAAWGSSPAPKHCEFVANPDGTVVRTGKPDEAEITFYSPGPKTIELRVRDDGDSTPVPAEVGVGGGDSSSGNSGRYTGTYLSASMPTYASEPDRQMIGGNIGVRLERSSVNPTRDQALWIAIRNRTHAIGFTRYSRFINRVLQSEELESFGHPVLAAKLKEQRTHLYGVRAYEILKLATEAFLLLECVVRISDGRDHRLYDPESEAARVGEPITLEYAKEKLRHYLGPRDQLPYITRCIEAAFPEWLDGSVGRDRVITGGINEPCLIELIWSYWQEEGMLAQSMNAITRRFQNVRAPGERDALAHLELDSLREMNNVIWGFIQDEPNRLSVKRRAHEYEHQYGLTLFGKAIGRVRPADSRSKFLEAFHNLLHLSMIFFKEDNDTTVIADGYPLLNALKDTHEILAQGFHNQAGSMPWTARAEMMLQQYILSRPELREFLQSRPMVPYKEPWMPQVDTMKTLQGWTDVTITHFRDLAQYGEMVVLAVRFGDWIAINDEDAAKNWARYWKPELYGYVNAYRAATKVDLANSEVVDATVPAVLLQKRLEIQQQRMR